MKFLRELIQICRIKIYSNIFLRILVWDIVLNNGFIIFLINLILLITSITMEGE